MSFINRPHKYSINENLTELFGKPAYVEEGDLMYALFTKEAIYVGEKSNFHLATEGDQLLYISNELMDRVTGGWITGGWTSPKDTPKTVSRDVALWRSLNIWGALK